MPLLTVILSTSTMIGFGSQNWQKLTFVEWHKNGLKIIIYLQYFLANLFLCTNFIFINQSIIMKYSDLISELEVRWHNASSLAIKYYFSSPIKPSITYILSYLCNMYNIYLQHMPLIYLGLWLRYLLISFFLLFREFPVHAHCSRIQSESQ